MRRIGVALIAVIFVLSMVGCGGGGGAGEKVSEAEAQEGFAVAFGSFFMAMMSAGFGQPPEGVEMSEDGNEFTFDEFDVSDMETDYTTMSGTIGEKDGGMVADLQLAGGPVETISFEIAADFDLENTSEMDITVNGHDMTVGTADIGADMGM